MKLCQDCRHCHIAPDGFAGCKRTDEVTGTGQYAVPCVRERREGECGPDAGRFEPITCESMAYDAAVARWRAGPQVVVVADDLARARVWPWWLAVLGLSFVLGWLLGHAL